MEADILSLHSTHKQMEAADSTSVSSFTASRASSLPSALLHTQSPTRPAASVPNPDLSRRLASTSGATVSTQDDYSGDIPTSQLTQRPPAIFRSATASRTVSCPTVSLALESRSRSMSSSVSTLTSTSVISTGIHSSAETQLLQSAGQHETFSQALTQPLTADGSQRSGSGVSSLAKPSESQTSRPVPRAAMRTTLAMDRNETAAETAERSMSNTSDNVSDVSLDRIICRWQLYGRSTTTRVEQDAFFELDEKQQRRCTDSSGITSYGDLCSVHARLLLGLEVKASTVPGGGMGLFTTWKREKGDAICEYDGNIRLQRDDDETETLAGGYAGKYAIDLRPPHPFSAPVGSRWVIDAAQTTNGFARYANDFSLGDADRVQALCNCDFRSGNEYEPPRASNRVFLEANKHIDAGAELSVFYGTDYWTPGMKVSS